MAAKFKIGDVVVLKSGGPKMTVIDRDDDSLTTAWFDGFKKEEAYFPFDAVVAAAEEAQT